jgi:hypothetical protein
MSVQDDRNAPHDEVPDPCGLECLENAVKPPSGKISST